MSPSRTTRPAGWRRSWQGLCLTLATVAASPSLAVAQQADTQQADPQQADPQQADPQQADTQQADPQQTTTPQPAAQEQPASQQQGDGFADGDVVKITAFGRDDLTGQYTVQPGPLLSLPLIGAVQVGSLTPRQLETQLAKDWENRLGSPMSVTVEFSQRAPFYVLGAVGSPGAYPYRSGLTVLQAVAVSGGIEKAMKAGDNVRMDLIHERERSQQAIDKLARATARQARLLAERDGKDQVELDTPFTLLPKDQMDAIMAEESRLLDSRSKQYSIKEHLLSDQIKLGEQEIAAYQKQLDELDGQQGQLSKESARSRRLPGQQQRVFELDQRSVTLETTKSSTMASIARAKVDVETARNGIADLQEARQREITEALVDTQQAIRENEATVTAAHDVLASGEGNSGPTLVFKLLRNGKDDVPDVSSTTTMRPGDLLEVSIAPAAGQQQQQQQQSMVSP